MPKDTCIISEIGSFFKNNESNKAIHCIMNTIKQINLRSSHIDIEKRSNCKLTSLQVLELLLLFPFFIIKNAFGYDHSALSNLFFCQKDMFYRFMEQNDMNWRKLLYTVSLRLYNRIKVRSDLKTSTSCLIIDDTDLPKTGFRTEMIGRIYSHVHHKSILGFKGLFMCHTDGKTQMMLNFSLHGEEGKNKEKPQGLTTIQCSKRFTKERADTAAVNEHTGEYKQSKISRSIEMVKTAIKKGVRFDYLLVDNWFTCSELLQFITSRHIKYHLMGMIKMGKTKYITEYGTLKASDIIGKLSKSKSVKYSRRLNCYYAQIEVAYAKRKVKLFSAKEGGKVIGMLFLQRKMQANF